MKIYNHQFSRLTDLDKFWNEAWGFLNSNIMPVQYPSSLCGNDNISWDDWDVLVDDMRKNNVNLLNSLQGTSGVYGLFTRDNGHSSWEVTYIGHTSTSKQRITNHLFTKHEKTGAKLANVKSAIGSKKEIGVAFLNIEPEELRTYVEMKLIDSLRPVWNLKGKSKIIPPDSQKEVAIEEQITTKGARTIVLISCAKKQLPTKESARDLFISTVFRYSLEYGFKCFDPDAVLILSAKYGLLELDDIVEPYDVAMSKMPVAERKKWSENVLVHLNEQFDINKDKFILLAGKKYWEHLVPTMSIYEIPMKNLRIGEKSNFMIRKLKTT